MARKAKTTRPGSVRSLERGLALLVAMNCRQLASVAELAKDTHLPRPTVYRLLETLSRSGFASRDATDRYRPALGVRALSDGYLDDEWVHEVAAPLMVEFTREHVWPISLFTFQAGRMLVRETTHRYSALSIDYGMVGRRMPMLRTAAGLVYLAFCPDNERRTILDLLAHSDAPEDQEATENQRLKNLFKAIRAKGYAMQERVINPKAASISVPICIGPDVFGCMSLIWIASALTAEDAEKRLLSPLLTLSSRLSHGIQERRRVGPVRPAEAATARVKSPETA